MVRLKFFICLSLLFVPNVSWSSGIVGAGAALFPSYIGSRNTDLRPIGLFALRTEKYRIEVLGPEPVFLYHLSKNFGVGPIFTFDFGRSSVTGEGITQDTSTKLSIGGDYGIAADLELPNLGISDEDRFNVRLIFQESLQANAAFTARLNVRYFFKILFLLRTELEAEIRYSDDNYHGFYFGVDASTSNRSGLSTYDASHGFQNIMLAQNYILSFSRNYGILFRGIYWRLLDQASSSPYVRDIGDSNQLFLGTAFFYRWD